MTDMLLKVKELDRDYAPIHANLHGLYWFNTSVKFFKNLARMNSMA